MQQNSEFFLIISNQFVGHIFLCIRRHLLITRASLSHEKKSGSEQKKIPKRENVQCVMWAGTIFSLSALTQMNQKKIMLLVILFSFFLQQNTQQQQQH
jgi:hypothetical protein